ncbi:MAG: hypothetical protein ACHREM_10175 [Polyangiales bacterium]
MRSAILRLAAITSVVLSVSAIGCVASNDVPAPTATDSGSSSTDTGATAIDTSSTADTGSASDASTDAADGG